MFKSILNFTNNSIKYLKKINDEIKEIKEDFGEIAENYDELNKIKFHFKNKNDAKCQSKFFSNKFEIFEFRDQII